MPEVDNLVRQKFVRYIYKKIKEEMTGSNKDFVYGDKPQIQFFSGTLCSQNPRISIVEIRTKVAPVRMGVEFLLKKQDAGNAILKIHPDASVFYKVNAPYEKQFELTMKKNKCNESELLEKIREQTILAQEGKEDVSLGEKPLNVFKKHRIKDTILVMKLSDVIGSDYQGQVDLPEVKQMIDDIFDAYNSEDRIYRPKKRKIDEMDSPVPLSALENEQTYDVFMQNWGEKDVKPSWDFKITVKSSNFSGDCIKVSVIFENTCVAKENEHVDNFLFNTFLRVDVEGAKIQNFIIDYLNDHYKYNGDVGASGINCEAIRDEVRNSVYSEHMPFFEQKRLRTTEKVKPKFHDLGSENKQVCFEILEHISKEMKDYLENEYKALGKEQEFKSEIGRNRFNEDMRLFEDEIKRFEYGIEILKKYPLAFQAFKYMNITFSKASKSKAAEKTFDSWRVFQIIFIVMNIPDIIYTEYEDVDSHFERVEVLYFPTGGGKTESYLGLAIFTLFFDRLRGKNFGVSVITKFPLRLLSLQQIQRIANILAQAELVRRATPELNKVGSEEFSLGYFVGDRNTPNRLVAKGSQFGGEDKDILTPIIEERKKIEKGELKFDDENLFGRKYLILSKCPFCGSKEIMIDADLQKIRLYHRCMNKDCTEDILPIYVSDMEIYRYVPSFIISTLDKIAVCGWQKNFRNLLGQVTHKCPIHGYSSSSDCTEKWLCSTDKNKFERVKLYDPTPTLQIQDEMHLVRESLGTFNSHYESFFEQLEKTYTNNRRSIKIITATATIAEYRLQTYHLYLRDALLFPSQGPSLTESFYAVEDDQDLNRLIVGITPHYKTMIFAVLSILEQYHGLIEHYYRNPELLSTELHLDIKSDKIKKMIEDYRIKLSYHLAKNDGDAISNSIRTMSNKRLREKGIQQIHQRTLTGDITFDEVRKVLDKIEHPKGPTDNVDLIVATNMISHGVDLNELNFMIFMGIPTNAAEYIQASSRVGRLYPGMVFVLFNPTRERDQSYFKFFRKFHEYKNLLVEAVPINRWAKFSINRTLPGTFTGSVLNYFDSITTPTLEKSINMSKIFEKARDRKLFTDEEIKNFLIKSYKIDNEPLGFDFGNVINDKVDTFIYEITQSLENRFISTALSEKPMRSLRDVDEQIEINLSPEGMMVLRNIKAARTLSYEDSDEEEEE